MVDVPAAGGRRMPASGAVAILGMSLVASFVAAVLIVAGRERVAGVVALVAGAGLLAGTAKAARDGDDRALLAEAFADRAFDALLLASMAWASRFDSRGLDSERIAILALVALAASYLASYERARGQSLRYRGHEGLGYRGARVALLSLGLLTGWVESALWAFLALTASATAVRGWNVVRQERRS